MPRFTPAAQEVLGSLAALPDSGPHTARPLRRQTRLTPDAFDHALHELDALGLIRLTGRDAIWVTPFGESWVRRIFS